MKCYAHPTIDTVGICSTCSRGVCKSCQVIVQGKSYCKSDAERLLRNQKRASKLQSRGIAITAASTLAGLAGVSGMIAGFLMIIIWILGPLTIDSPLMASTLTPFLKYFINVTLFPAGQTIILGLLLTSVGAIDIAAGIVMLRGSKAGAIVSVVVSLSATGIVVVDVIALALAGDFLYVYVAAEIVKIALIGAGWGRLGGPPQPTYSVTNA